MWRFAWQGLLIRVVSYGEEDKGWHCGEGV
jgi:hypothetical protein